MVATIPGSIVTATGRVILPPAPPPLDLTEAQWQCLVVDLAWACGADEVWHDEDSRRNRAGLPDLLILIDGRLLWRELKTERGRVRPDQRRWGELLKARGQDWAIWRPSMWDAVIRDLAGLPDPANR